MAEPYADELYGEPSYNDFFLDAIASVQTASEPSAEELTAAQFDAQIAQFDVNIGEVVYDPFYFSSLQADELYGEPSYSDFFLDAIASVQTASEPSAEELTDAQIAQAVFDAQIAQVDDVIAQFDQSQVDDVIAQADAQFDALAQAQFNIAIASATLSVL